MATDGKYKVVVYLNVDTDVEAREFITSAIDNELVLRGSMMKVEDFNILILDNEDDEE